MTFFNEVKNIYINFYRTTEILIKDFNRTKKIEYFKGLRHKIQKCYNFTSELIMAGMHSIAGNILVLFATLIAIFNVDLKILFFDVTTDPGFSLLNEIIFFVLGLEFFLLILFKTNYVGSFFFYGDWGLGIGDWGLGIGPIPNPQSPIPNPH
jgi:hypothetical protein